MARIAETIDAVILCGGQGLRLRPVIGDCPNSLAPIHGTAFLHILLHFLSGYGIERFIFCSGHRGDAIEDQFANLSDARTYVFSREDQPLGTAGALKNAETYVKSDPFLVLNGASLCPADLGAFAATHKSKKAVASIVATQADANLDRASIEVDSDNRVIGFANTTSAIRRLSSAGIYLFDRSVLDRIPVGRHASLEDEVLPALVGSNFYAYLTDALLIDIATPERYGEAQGLLRSRVERLCAMNGSIYGRK